MQKSKLHVALPKGSFKVLNTVSIHSNANKTSLGTNHEDKIKMAKRSKNKTSNQEKGSNPLFHPTNSVKQKKGQNNSVAVDFRLRRQGPLVLLHFKTPLTQHEALARMEAFYESKSEAKTYISLQDPKTKFLCRNYQAFNLPVCAIQEWLQAMQSSEKVFSSSQGNENLCSISGWWRPFTNSEESVILNQLWSLGLLKAPKGHEPSSYLISVTDKSAIHHELLHALFFLHSGYRDKAQEVWERLSSKCRMVVSNDLLMRDYGEHVWVDEFQAYVNENAGEFGKKVRAECEEAAKVLREAQTQAWKELNLDVAHFN